MSALGRLLKKSSLEQILLNRKDMLEGIYFLPWDGQQDDLKRYWCFYRCFKYLWDVLNICGLDIKISLL